MQLLGQRSWCDLGSADPSCYSFCVVMVKVGYPLLASFLALSAGCGRKATQADCDLIVDRHVEVQLHAMNIVDPAEVAKQEAAMRAELKEDELKDCVGKRVTNGMMACVGRAKTNQEIDKCTH